MKIFLCGVFLLLVMSVAAPLQADLVPDKKVADLQLQLRNSRNELLQAQATVMKQAQRIAELERENTRLQNELKLQSQPRLVPLPNERLR